MKFGLEKVLGKVPKEPVKPSSEEERAFKEACRVVARYLGPRTENQFKERWKEAAKYKPSKTHTPQYIMYYLADEISREK
jgi:hypothetical protein